MSPPSHSPQPNIQTPIAETGFSVRFWMLVVLTGICAGLFGGLLMKLLHAVQHAAWSYSSGSFLGAVEASSTVRRIACLLGAGLLAGVVRWSLRRTFGQAGGELSETIWLRSGRFSTVPAIARGLLSIIIVGLGASLGREGALKQTGAAIAARLSAWAGLPISQMRLLAAYGAGAGMAAAYNVPCGGALFALEVLLGGLSLPLVVPALATSSIATVVSWLLLPNRPAYAVPDYSLSVTQVAWAFIAGPFLGLASVIWIRAVAWARARQPSGSRTVLAPLLVFAALGGAAALFPQLPGNGKDVVQAAFTDQFSLGLLAVLPGLKFLATVACLRSGAPGGLFTPTMTFGALLGGLLGYACDTLFPSAPLGSYSILGSAAVLAAATQGPVSAVVLILELTWQIEPLMAPLLVIVVGATVVAHHLEPRSIYASKLTDVRCQASGLSSTPLAELAVPELYVISAAARHAKVMQFLLTYSRRMPLYVVDDRGNLVGEIWAAHVSQPNSLPVPPEMAIASDLAVPIYAVTSSQDRSEVLRRLAEVEDQQLPVVDAISGRLLGAVASFRGRA